MSNTELRSVQRRLHSPITVLYFLLRRPTDRSHPGPPSISMSLLYRKNGFPRPVSQSRINLAIANGVGLFAAHRHHRFKSTNSSPGTAKGQQTFPVSFRALVSAQFALVDVVAQSAANLAMPASPPNVPRLDALVFALRKNPAN